VPDAAKKIQGIFTLRALVSTGQRYQPEVFGKAHQCCICFAQA